MGYQVYTSVINLLVLCKVERPSLLLENVKKQKQQQQCDFEKIVQDFRTPDTEMTDLLQQGIRCKMQYYMLK